MKEVIAHYIPYLYSFPTFVYFCSMSNVVFDYFEMQEGNMKIIVQLNPMDFSGQEIILLEEKGEQKLKHRHMQYDESIYEDFKADGFKRGSPIEFNLLLSKIK